MGFHKIRHEGLPTLRKVHKYKETQSNETDNLDLKQQEDAVIMKFLRSGRAEGLELPFVASVNTEENKEASNALTIVKEFLRIKPMKSLRSLQKRNFGTPSLVLGIAYRGDCTVSTDPDFVRLAREKRELVNIRQRKHDQVLKKEHIVVFICGDLRMKM